MILTRVQSTRPTAPGVKITLGPRNSLVRLSARPRGRSGWRAQIARPASRRLPFALRRGKASPQRGNEEKRALAAGEAASRVRRPAEARSRPTVRRLGCGTPARRGGGASPTTYRGMCRARGAGRRAKTRGCGTTRPKKGEGRAAELDQNGPARPRSGPQPSTPQQIDGGLRDLRPEGVLVYAERSHRRANRPICSGRTVAPTEAAGLEGRDGAGGAGVGRSRRRERGYCLCIKITVYPNCANVGKSACFCPLDMI